MILSIRVGWSAAAFAALTLVSCGFKHAKYDNPITKDTQQPDKILFDKAVNDIEHGRYEVARLTLNTLINTYDTSEFLAKAKLAIADSWYREGGIQGLTQAEAEYKDFILFYPTMEEAAESQKRLCDIHYKQMEKADRDPNQTLRAEQECKQVLTQFPNSKFAPPAEQELRNIQEVLAEGEMTAGDFYYKKGAWAAAANRMTGIADTYPLYSRVDEALWKEADAYGHMGTRFRGKTGDALASLVRNYPLSPYADEAKKKLTQMELEVPEADPAAVARMKFEQENRTKTGMMHRATGFVRGAPETAAAAKSGTPQMNNPRQNIPANVPLPAGSEAAGFAGDVTVAPVNGTSALDTKPDARSAGAPADGTTATSSTSSSATPAGASSTSTGGSAASAPANGSTDDNASTKGKTKPKKQKQQKPQAQPSQPQSQQQQGQPQQ
jgi:outer membrane protein assembly factor BamD